MAALIAVALLLVIVVSRTVADPRITIVNNSKQPLEQISCTLSDAAGNRWTKRVSRLEPGGTINFSESTPDLFIVSVEFQLQGKWCNWPDGGGIATPGEVLELQIDSQGMISTAYEHRFGWLQ